MSYMLYSGALLDRAPGNKYGSTLRFAEISLRAPLPKAGTFSKWRNGLPPNFIYSLVAPKSALVSKKGALRFDETLEENVKWLNESAEALKARFIVLPTGSELTPGQRDREVLAAYVDRLRADGRQIVWAPSGLWEPEEAAAYARKLDLVYGFDPLETVAPKSSVVYARLAAIGFRNRFTDEALELMLANFANADAKEAFVAFDSAQSHRDATRLVKIASEMAQAGDEEDDDEDFEDDDLDEDDEDFEDDEDGDEDEDDEDDE